MTDLRVTRYSHYFSVFAFTVKGRIARRAFSEKFIEMALTKKRGRFIKEQKRIFARRDLNKEEVSFHINCYDDFIDSLRDNGIRSNDLEIIDTPMYEPVRFKFKTETTPWENQVPLIEFCAQDGIQKVITLQPGGGKTLISLLAAAANGTRFAVITLGGYEDRWVPEFYEKLNLKPHEVRSCCGCVKLYRLLREVQATGIPEVKAIFISTATIRDFIKNWNSGKVVGSGCEDIHPETLWEFLGVGLRITDEVHKEFHGNFVGDLYAHIPKTIYLTATLFPNTDFMREMYEIALPKRVRREPAKLNVYVECVRTLYNLKDPQKARTVGGQGSYSHTTYEQWIMADPKRENNYLEAIYVYALNNWMVDRRPEHKLLIFAATIEMCQKLCQYFLRRAPDLISNSYTAGDDYQLLIDSDIICSTIGKSGTAVDIPFLTQAYLTVAIDSPNANVQALGRLRELKGDDAVAQSFHVFICLNIEKHMAYWDSKSKLFSNRITKVRTAYLDRVI